METISEDGGMDAQPILHRIVTLLDEAACPYEVIEHASVSTAQEAANARATALEHGTKAMLLKYDDDFGIFALNAAQQIRSARIRRGLRVKRTRFATRDELHAMTGLQPGAVPPFGEPVLPLPLFADPSALAHEHMLFTAGSHTTSIRLATSDYRRLAKPRELPFIR